MAAKFIPGYADPKGAIICGFDGNIIIAEGDTVPTAATPGYAPGCVFLKRAGGATTSQYKNEGTALSCSFVPVTPVGQSLTTGAGAGITSGVGAVYKSDVWQSGGIIYTNILVDLTGLASSTTDLDIIGVGSSAAHLGQLTAAQNGTIYGGRMTCLEVPAGGVTDIDLYWATEGTGVFDGLVTALTETALITAGAAWTLALAKAIADPVGIANGYLYLTAGAAGTPATYTAGKFLLELFGY